MTELTIQEIETIIRRDENRIMEAKQTTGELTAGMQSGCAFLNTEGGWLFFGIHPKKLTILGQDVADQTRQDIANAFRKFSPAIFDLCKENGLPKPEFELANGYVYLTIRFAKPLTPRLSGDTDNITDELTERQRLIVKLLPFDDTEDVTETTTSLAQKAGVTRRTIARDMEVLKEKGYVVRIGPDNGGHWKCLK